MYFVAMAIKLRLPNRNSRLTISDGVYAHAAVCHAISGEDSNVGRKIHHMGRNKPISLALLNKSKGTAILRLTFIGEDGLSCANHLVNALNACPTIQIGKARCEIEEIDPANSEWAGISTWADLICDKPVPYLSFQFLTPTAITKKDGRGERLCSLYPEPRDVFLGLARRYQSLEGPNLPGDLGQFLEEGGCVVSEHNLRSTVFKTKERTQKGFTGTVVYECRMHDQVECNTAINTLTRLARFTGIGYQTARGMGAVQVSLR